MTGPGQTAGVEGMARIAHALRRSTALYVAMQITPAESSVDEMLMTADRLAAWIKSDIADPHGGSGQMPSFPSR